jgi:hypothetical protein
MPQKPVTPGLIKPPNEGGPFSRGSNRSSLPELLLPSGSSFQPPDSRIPLHPGALGYFKGEPMPALEPHPREDHIHGSDAAQ